MVEAEYLILKKNPENQIRVYGRRDFAMAGATHRHNL